MSENITHPSFGQMSLGRVQAGQGVVCYGSKLHHTNYISLVISQSEERRSLFETKHNESTPIIRVRMTENQFAQMITGLNTRGGSVCTIERLNGQKIDDPPTPEDEK